VKGNGLVDAARRSDLGLERCLQFALFKVYFGPRGSAVFGEVEGHHAGRVRVARGNVSAVDGQLRLCSGHGDPMYVDYAEGRGAGSCRGRSGGCGCERGTRQ
jgi:hypothetical protein